jgi:uncharacterized protein YndB with AHSA1/START domain
MDLRVGGTYHYSMKMNGTEMWGKFTYREITPPQKLVFVSGFSDAKGGITRHPFNQAWPLQMLSTITFSEPAKGKTKVAIYWTPLNANAEELKAFADNMASMTQGWTGTLDCCAEFLKG